jgi:hypothetical protein
MSLLLTEAIRIIVSKKITSKKLLSLWLTLPTTKTNDNKEFATFKHANYMIDSTIS